ncbi:MAG: hypothetical protein P4L67_02340 [Candidatus Pacebacteria bacterium]|nr:hypothetical protein [Candidatus Paceibacterota bacterium]
MSQTVGDRTAIVSVPPGRVYFRYVVDGVEQHDPDKDNELFGGTSLAHFV